MLELGFKALGAYLLGSVIGSLLLGTLRFFSRLKKEIDERLQTLIEKLQSEVDS